MENKRQTLDHDEDDIPISTFNNMSLTDMEIKNASIPDPIYIMIDIDSFEVQVWIEKYPELAGKPLVVHNSSKKIIAVSYEAKFYGVARSDQIIQAMEKCRDLYCFEIPNQWGKPDQKTPRHAGQRLKVCAREFIEKSGFNASFEMASKDEMFCEVHKEVKARLSTISSNQTITYPIQKTILMNGNEPTEEDIRYQIGGVIAGEILEHIKSVTGFQGSAGVGKNMLISKLACGINKPAGVTIVTPNGMGQLYGKTKLQDASELGGKRGAEIVKKFTLPDGSPIVTLKDFTSIENTELISLFGEKIGKTLDKLAKGECDKVIQDKQKATIMCSKMTFGKNCLKNENDLKTHLKMLCEEMCERLEEELEWNQRRPDLIKVNLQRNKKRPSPLQQLDRRQVRKSDSGTFKCPEDISTDSLLDAAMFLLEENWKKAEASRPISFASVSKLGLTAKKFKNIAKF